MKRRKSAIVVKVVRNDPVRVSNSVVDVIMENVINVHME